VLGCADACNWRNAITYYRLAAEQGHQPSRRELVRLRVPLRDTMLLLMPPKDDVQPCAVCPLLSVRCCAGCDSLRDAPRYCCVLHQAAHWPEHRKVCASRARRS
jgi:TPR repeat protein